MPSITVLDSTGAPQTVQTLPGVGQALKASSLPVTLASDQPALSTTQQVSGANISPTNPLPAFGSMPFNESSTVLAGNATFTGTARDSGVVSGASSNLAYFNTLAFADQTGTISIEASWDNITWTKVASATLTVSTPVTLQIPVMFRYHRAKLVNGASAQGVLQISSAYTAS